MTTRSIFTALAVCCVVLGCQDADLARTTTVERPTQALPSVSTRAWTPAELHERNPADWVGAAHNQIIRAILTEWQKPDVRLGGICSRIMHWIDQPQSLAAYHAKLPADWRVQLKRAFEASAICRRFGSGRLAATGSAHSPPSVSPMQEIGPEAEAAINDVYAAIDASSTPSELASALGPILDLTYGMGETDAAVVQAVISVAQNSFEEYYADNYATIAGAEAEIEAELDDCFQGQMENQTYEADGITYVCRNSEWLQARFRQGQGVVAPSRLVADRPVAFACASWTFKLRAITYADAYGGTNGAIAGIPGGPAGILAGSIASAASWSEVALVGVAAATFFCLYAS